MTAEKKQKMHEIRADTINETVADKMHLASITAA